MMLLRIQVVFVTALVVWTNLGVELHANCVTEQGRIIWLTLIPDYVHNSIEFDARIDYDGPPPDAFGPCGIPLEVESYWDKDQSRYVIGRIRGGTITAETDRYQLAFGPIHLQPRDILFVVMTYANVDVRDVRPEPDYPPSDLVFTLGYAAGQEKRYIPEIIVPFTPLEKHIDLTLMPLVGGTLITDTTGLRVLGKVTFLGLDTFDLFKHHCEGSVSEREYEYRNTHLYFILDYPPASFAHLHAASQYKSTHLALHSDLISCHYDALAGTGQVSAVFSGRVVPNEVQLKDLPQLSGVTDSVDGNFLLTETAPVRLRLQLGKVRLAPGDLLTMTVRNSEILVDRLPSSSTISMVPASPNEKPQTRLVYHGPNTFEISLIAIPEAQLFLEQAPNIALTITTVLREKFSTLAGADNQPLMGRYVFTIAIVLLFAASGFKRRGVWLRTLAFVLASIVLLDTIHGTFGLLLFVLALHLSCVKLPYTFDVAAVLVLSKICAVAAIVQLSSMADIKAINFFDNLSYQLSPLTPVLMVLAAGGTLLFLYGIGDERIDPQQEESSAFILVLMILATYEVINNSLISIVLLAVIVGFIQNRLFQPENAREENAAQMQKTYAMQIRMERLLSNRFVLVALLALIFLSLQYDLSRTSAVQPASVMAGVFGLILVPVLVVVSVSLSFISMALLFLLLYPALPFRTGYLNALLFTAFLTIVFLFGVGADDRLIMILPSLLVGRFLFYLSVPLIIGLWFDIEATRRDTIAARTASGESNPEVSFSEAGASYLKPLTGKLTALVSIVSIVAPYVYNFVSNEPVVTTYFNLLELLVMSA